MEASGTVDSFARNHAGVSDQVPIASLMIRCSALGLRVEQKVRGRFGNERKGACTGRSVRHRKKILIYRAFLSEKAELK
jgi:hypothetical protein